CERKRPNCAWPKLPASAGGIRELGKLATCPTSFEPPLISCCPVAAPLVIEPGLLSAMAGVELAVREDRLPHDPGTDRQAPQRHAVPRRPAALGHLLGVA